MLSWSRLFYSILQFLKSLLLTLFPSLEKENVKGKGDTACVIPESVNYHFTRQCNYNCEEIKIKLELLSRNNWLFLLDRRVLFSHGQNVISPSIRRRQERSRYVEGGGNEKSKFFWW